MNSIKHSIQIAVALAMFAAVTATHLNAAESAVKATPVNREPADDLNPKPKLVEFPSGSLTLHGWLYVPEGKGPFPAVIYNHGSEKIPGWFPSVAKFYVEKGYVFFAPHRHGHGRSDGEYIVDLQQKYRDEHGDNDDARRNDIALHERYNLDVVAAVKWLKQQPSVKADQVIMSGISYGGIQTVLSSEKDLGLKAYVPFAPAAMSWEGNPLLRERLLTAVKNAKAPVFLLQAENDYNLGPSHLLGPALAKRGKPYQSKIYPVFGSDPNDHAAGHGKFAVSADGVKIWSPDVLAFLDAVKQ